MNTQLMLDPPYNFRSEFESMTSDEIVLLMKMMNDVSDRIIFNNYHI